MGRRIWVIIICFLLMACKGGQPKELYPVDIQRYIYPVDSKDSTTIGFATYEDGEVLSALSIAIAGNYAFIVDPVKSVIWKINLETGARSASEKLPLGEQDLPETVTFFNNALYLFSYHGDIIALDTALNLSSQQRISNYIGDKKIFLQSKDTLSIYRHPVDRNFSISVNSEGVEYSTDFKVFLLSIAKDNTLSYDTLIYAKSAEENSEYERGHFKGQEISWLTKEDGPTLLWKNKEYHLKSPIPEISSYLCLNNFDISDQYIVSFDINDKQIELVVRKYR